MLDAELSLANQAHRRASDVISLPVSPHTATLVRCDSYSRKSGNEAIATKKGSREMQGDGVEMQIWAKQPRDMTPSTARLGARMGPMG